ncbi:hypothetical protein [Paludisphaera borealis]|uniref:Phage tail protein n=1 Tax=Paludisphaera borealis TaxID=1387353 RepID=A0A1U7CX65_9BACT|nr:hypothetical protein [Paludisphaera borealis]APW63542.1 hypothetical protein BSF38_05114 [Paludisphaera borealis]
MGMSLSDLLAVKRKVVKVETPAGEVFVRELTVGEIRAWVADKDETLEKAKMLALSLSDEGGNPLADQSNVDALNSIPDSTAQPIYLAAMKLNGFIKDPVDPKPQA